MLSRSKISSPYSHKDYNGKHVLTRSQIRDIARASHEEIPTTAFWRRLMSSTRADMKLSQTKLADLVGATQPAISDVESGKTPTSRLVPAISAALRISLPFIQVQDTWDSRWVDVGRLLRRRNMKLFNKYLDMLEVMVSSYESD